MKKTLLSSYNNDWYTPGNKIKILVWYFINRLFFNTSFPYFSSMKTLVLRIFGAKIGKSVIIKPRVSIKFPWLLIVGDNVWIGENVWIDNLSMVIIRNNVCISQGAMLLCGNHDYTKPTFDLIVKKINLEEGSWVGAKSIVGPGVTLNSHSILTAGSIATKDLEPYSIYQGNPARKLRSRKIK